MPAILLTPEEIAWAKKTHPQTGDMLDELNQRCRSYVGYSGMGVKEAQERTLKDFEGFYEPGQFVAISKPDDQYGPFFTEAGNDSQLLA